AAPLARRPARVVRLPGLPARAPRDPARPPRVRPLPRSRLQRAGHDDDPVRHGRPERHEPLPPVHRGPPAGAGRACAEAGRGLPGHARAAPALRARSLRGHARGARLDAVRGVSVPPLRLLCVTPRSSSLTFALYELGEREVALATGAVERL